MPCFQHPSSRTPTDNVLPALALAGQHAYRTRFNSFAGNNHIFQMALFLSTIPSAAFGTNSLAIILYCLNMPAVTLRLTEFFAVVFDIVRF